MYILNFSLLLLPASAPGDPDHRLNMELDLQCLFGLLCTAQVETPQLPPSSRIWAHILGRYWSAKIDYISL
jgi:hypothetical protein